MTGKIKLEEKTLNKKNLNAFIKAERNIINAKVDGIRVISHPGEKGRAGENEVMQLVRSFLPAEYGISTGFIAYHDSDYEIDKINNVYHQKAPVPISSQLDIIIYDALRSGPIVRLGTCDVFPIEAVYGYIECKLSAESDDILKCLEKCNNLRKMTTRIYRECIDVNEGKLVDDKPPMSIRSYLFIMDGDSLGTPKTIKNNLENGLKTNKNTLITVYIHGKGFYRQHIPGNGTFDFIEEGEKALLQFKISLLEDLSRFPRIADNSTPAIDTYFSNIEDTISVNYAAVSAAVGPVPVNGKGTFDPSSPN
jgi:hypothetical protein